MGLAVISTVMQPAKLEVDQQPLANGTIVARVSGRLSLESVNGFLQELRRLDAPSLVLDMSGVSFLDSAGVGALVQLFVHRRGLGKSFALAGLSKQSQAVMEVAGLTKLLPIHNSVEEALAKAQ